MVLTIELHVSARLRYSDCVTVPTRILHTLVVCPFHRAPYVPVQTIAIASEDRCNASHTLVM